MSITQFPGETRFDAIINHFGLDLSDEEEFFLFLKDKDMGVHSEDDELEEAHREWLER